MTTWPSKDTDVPARRLWSIDLCVDEASLEADQLSKDQGRFDEGRVHS